LTYNSLFSIFNPFQSEFLSTYLTHSKASSYQHQLKILGEQGLTILLVSQEVELSLALSNRAYVLENGQITLEGKSCDLLNDDKVRESYLGM
jgi:ABC-type branched-subunit amino acid transport system ATPase component